MPLEITSREQEGIEVLELKGPLTFGQEDLDFRNAVDGLLRAGKTRVVLDLQGVSELDSTGVGTMEVAAEQFHKAGGGLAIAHLNPSHIDLVLDADLHIYADELDAINSFFPGREVKPYDVLEFVRSRMQKPD